MILFRKLSLWFALLGFVGLALVVLRTTAEPAMPALPAPGPAKPPGPAIGAVGLVESFRENTRVGPPVAGVVTAVHVKVWDEVKAGDVLFQLDDRELQSQLRQITAEIAVRAAELDRARRLQARTEQLRRAGSISLEEAETREDDLAIATGRLAAARATLGQTEAALSLRTVRAPRAGTVLQVNIRPGEFLAPGGSAPPLLLGDIADLQVRVDIDEQLAPRIRVGQTAVGYLKGETTLPIAMTFVRIEPYVVPKQNLSGSSLERVDTRVLQVIYRFTRPPDRAIYVGQQIHLFISD
jgi:HlyD family secretion protein